MKPLVFVVTYLVRTTPPRKSVMQNNNIHRRYGSIVICSFRNVLKSPPLFTMNRSRKFTDINVSINRRIDLMALKYLYIHYRSIFLHIILKRQKQNAKIIIIYLFIYLRLIYSVITIKHLNTLIVFLFLVPVLSILLSCLILSPGNLFVNVGLFIIHYKFGF